MHRPCAHSLRLLVLPLLLVGCGTAVPDYEDPNSVPVGGDLSNVDPKADTDGDGVFDRDEGSADTNMNGTPAHLDSVEVILGGVTDDKRDTDGDGVPDLTEGVGDSNGNEIPAYRDPDERGGSSSGDGGIEGGTGQGLPFGTACTASDTCASVGGATGCCEPATMTCSAMSGGGCVTGQVCGGVFCGGAGACCTNTDTCGVLASDTVTCEPVGSAGDGGTGDGSTDSGVVTTCPDSGGDPGCCADDGKCGVMNSVFGCLRRDNPIVDPTPPEIACQ